MNSFDEKNGIDYESANAVLDALKESRARLDRMDFNDPDSRAQAVHGGSMKQHIAQISKLAGGLNHATPTYLAVEATNIN